MDVLMQLTGFNHGRVLAIHGLTCLCSLVLTHKAVFHNCTEVLPGVQSRSHFATLRQCFVCRYTRAGVPLLFWYFRVLGNLSISLYFLFSMKGSIRTNFVPYLFWYVTSTCRAIKLPKHCVCFPTASLTVCKDA